MALTDAQVRAMGFDLPVGTDLIRNGDDNISKNARAAANLITDLQGSITDVQGSISEVEDSISNLPELPSTVTNLGFIDATVDANDFRTDGSTSVLTVRNNNLLNGPAISENLIVYLETISTAFNNVFQRASTRFESWSRAAIDSNTWGPWRKHAFEDSALSTVTNLGYIDTTVDANDFRTDGSTSVLTVRNNNLLNGPAISENLIVYLETIRTAFNNVFQRASTRFESWSRAAIDNNTFGPWRKHAFEDDISGGSGIEWDDDNVPYISEGAGANPQPAWRRLVTESSAPAALPSTVVESPAIKRIRVSTDPNMPLENGDLLLVYGE